METLGTFLAGATARFGDRPALLYTPRYRREVWSYARLGVEAGRAAALLAAHGVRQGDRVVFWAPNSPAWVAAFFGALHLGAIVVPLDLRSSPAFVDRVVGATEPKLALLARATRAAWTWPVPVAALDDGDQPEAPAPPAAMLGPDAIAEVLFTSGTTGDPKGVILTHGNILANVAAVGGLVPGGAEARLLSILPLSHTFEQTIGLLLPLGHGASITYPRGRGSAVLLRALQDGGITTMLVVPQALELLMAAIRREVRKEGREQAWARLLQIAAPLPLPARRRLFGRVHRRLGGRLRFFVCGGAPLAPALIDAWERIGIAVVQGYGTTEAAPVITAGSLGERNPRSVGKAVPGVALRVAADGEVQVRGPNITPGYWRNPAATEAAFAGDWYCTGDLGTLDPAGYLYLHGRKRDLIVLANGQNVYPDDVEAALKALPGVVDAAVIGLPAGSGTAVHAVLLLDTGAGAPAGLVRAANARLAAHQQIAGWTVWPEVDFPRTHTLKVQKHAVREAILAGGPAAAAPDSTAPAGAAVAPVQRLLAEIAGVPVARLAAEATLGADLGLDSLGRVELLAAIEAELGVYLDDTAAGPETTVAALEQLVGAGTSSAAPRFPTWPRTPLAGAVRTALQLPAGVLLAGLAPATVAGRAVLDGLAPPVIFVANHGSHLDTPVLLAALPGRWRRRVAVAAAADYFFARPATGAAVALLANAFPFARSGAVRATLEGCAGLLDKGLSILLYPEGTRGLPGQIGAFQAGVGLLAVELGVPVVPVRLGGVGRVLPKGARVPRRGPVTVHFGPPLHFGPGVAPEEATAAIRAAVCALPAAAAPGPAAKGERVGYLHY